MDAFLQAQLGINLALQQIGGLTAIMQGASFLGTEDFFMIAFALLYLCVDASLGGRLVILLLLGDALKDFLKVIFHQPRPYWIDTRVQRLAEEPTYGIPSGHAHDATLVWFFIAHELKKPWAWVSAAALVLLISFSRLYLGVHFLSDVGAGVITGGIFLIVYLQLESRVGNWLAGLGLWRQIGAAVAGSILIVLLGILAQTIVAGSPDAPAWDSFAQSARRLDDFVSLSGMFLGGGAGLAMMFQWARFDARGSMKNRIIRFALGVGGVLILRFGLSALFPKEPEMIGLVFRFVRYAVMAWWLIYLAPWLALKMKLAERA